MKKKETHAGRRSLMFNDAIELQRDFDRLAAAHDAASTDQIDRRTEMLALLSSIDVRISQITALSETAEPSDAQRLAELKSANIDALGRFNRVAEAYTSSLHADKARGTAMRRTLSAFFSLRARLRELGTDAPDLIEHESTARALEPHARKAANLG